MEGAAYFHFSEHKHKHEVERVSEQPEPELPSGIVDLVKELKRQGYVLLKKDEVMPLLEELKELKGQADLIYTAQLGGLSADELEQLVEYNRGEAWVWERVLEHETNEQEREKIARFIEFHKDRALIFSEWSASEERSFEQWQEHDKKAKARTKDT